MQQPTISAPPTAPGQQTAPVAYSIPSAYAGLFPPSVHWDERLRGVPRMKMAPPITFEEELARLSEEIRAYELRYEMKSEKAWRLHRKGELRETAEVVQWLMDYQVMKAMLRKLPTRTAGARGRTTRPSTKPNWRITLS